MLRTVLAVGFLACSAAFGLAQDASTPSQAPASRPQQVSISAAVLAGMVDQKSLPQYPEEALRKGVQGDVIFKVVVDESGTVVHTEPVTGDAMLIAAASEALRQYRFHPYLLDGSPIKVQGEMGFHFTLSRKDDTTEGHVECMTEVP